MAKIELVYRLVYKEKKNRNVAYVVMQSITVSAHILMHEPTCSHLIMINLICRYKDLITSKPYDHGCRNIHQIQLRNLNSKYPEHTSTWNVILHKQIFSLSALSNARVCTYESIVE